MAEQPPKRRSYPSSQRRQGPAPLASFEDLSDEIESPTEKNSHPMPEIREDIKLNADASANNTARLSPLTPEPLGYCDDDDDETTITTGGSAEFSHEGSRDSVVATTNFRFTPTSGFGSTSGFVPTSGLTSFGDPGHGRTSAPSFTMTSGPASGSPMKNSKSSSFMDDVRGAEAAEARAGRLPERAVTPEVLQSRAVGSAKKHSLVSADSRTPSRTPSPSSPRRFFSFFKHRDESEPASPASPKSPRKSSFTNLFKLAGRRSPADERSVSPGSTSASSRGGLGIFFRSKDPSPKNRKTPESEPEVEPEVGATTSGKGRKEASNRSVFSNLFKKSERKAEARKLARVKLTLQASSVDVPVEIGSTGWTSREISLHSNLCDLLDDDDDEPKHVVRPVEEKKESVEVYRDAEEPGASPPSVSPPEDAAMAAAEAARERRAKRPQLDRGDAVEMAPSPAETRPAKTPSDDRISSGSEVESDYDPVSFKRRPAAEDHEVETLIATEESTEYDDDEAEARFALRQEMERPRPQRQRLVDVTTTPIERPRSSTPLGVTSIEAYIDSPPSTASAKLRVSLPGDEFVGRGRGRRVPVKNWRDFCQGALQSPRTKRREGEGFAAWVTFENPPVTVGGRRPSDSAIGPRVSERELDESDRMFEARRFSEVGRTMVYTKPEVEMRYSNGSRKPEVDVNRMFDEIRFSDGSWTTFTEPEVDCQTRFSDGNQKPEVDRSPFLENRKPEVDRETRFSDNRKPDVDFDQSLFSENRKPEVDDQARFSDESRTTSTKPEIDDDDRMFDTLRFPEVDETPCFQPEPFDHPTRISDGPRTIDDCRCDCHQRPNGTSGGADASSQTSGGWARDRSTQMPSQDSTTAEPLSHAARLEATRDRATQMPSQDSVEAPKWTDGTRDPLLPATTSNGSEESECECDTTGEFADAHSCSEHSTSPNTTTFDRCHVFFPRDGDDRNGV